MAGNASRESTLEFGAIAREILAGAKAIGEAENELYGEARGDELPEQLRTRKARGVFRRAREQRDRQRDASKPKSGLAPDDDPQDEFAFDVERMVARGQGGERWWREGRRQLEQRRGQTSDPVPRSREDRLLLAAQRLEDERDAKIAANQAYEEYRATGRDTQGHRLGTCPNPWTAPDVPDGMVSVSDPDSQRMKARSRLSPYASTPKGIILPRRFHGSGRPRANHRGGPGEARLRERHPRPQRGSRGAIGDPL